MAAFGILSAVAPSLAQTHAPRPAVTTNILAVIQGLVEVARAGADVWQAGVLNQSLAAGDRVRTGTRSRSVVYLINGVDIVKGPFAEFEIPPSAGANFKRGLFRVFERTPSRSREYKLPTATAAIRGTDFLVFVGDGGRSELTVIDGEVLVTNPLGYVVVTNAEQAIVEPGAAPRRAPILEAVNNLMQWRWMNSVSHRSRSNHWTARCKPGAPAICCRLWRGTRGTPCPAPMRCALITPRCSLSSARPTKPRRRSVLKRNRRPPPGPCAR
jgi:hypothetical protein